MGLLGRIVSGVSDVVHSVAETTGLSDGSSFTDQFFDIHRDKNGETIDDRERRENPPSEENQ